VTRGAVVWITGLPSSGKSTLARAVAGELERARVPACTLDGDEVRNALVPSPGYSARQRADFYESLARLAALLAGQGLVVLVPATAHRRAFRDQARRLFPRFLEVWVDTALSDAMARDAKGLYASAPAGQNQVPGLGVEYEAPDAPDLVAHGGADTDAVRTLIALLQGPAAAGSDASGAFSDLVGPGARRDAAQ
jgi:adenylylsulfate kinase